VLAAPVLADIVHSCSARSKTVCFLVSHNDSQKIEPIIDSRNYASKVSSKGHTFMTFTCKEGAMWTEGCEANVHACGGSDTCR
jgi:hypothetical protein